MRHHDREPRLHLDAPLEEGAIVQLEAQQAHRLRHVLRLEQGATLRLFNAASGEWRAELLRLDRRGGEARLGERLRAPAAEPGPRLAVAPIRANRLDWLVEKAVELGVASLDLVVTRRTIVRATRSDRLLAIATEAAEQCGRLGIPSISGPVELGPWLARLPAGAIVVVADETGGEPPLAALRRLPDAVLLVGPEGGFAPEERRLLGERPGTVRVGLGPRILRSETAALCMMMAVRLARDTEGSLANG